jgi:thymidylate kinase
VQEGLRVIVDFVGLPGAGKSTLAQAVAALLEGDGVSAMAGENGGTTAADGRRLSRWERLGFRIASVWANPGLIAACAPIVLRPGGTEDLPMFVNLCRRDRALRVARPKGILLLHESSLHRLCIALALVERSSPDVVERFVRRMAWPDALVYLEVEPAVATERVRERLERMGPVAAADIAALDAGAAWRQRYADASEHALRVIARSKPVLRLDGSSEGVPRLAVAVRSWLEELRGVDARRPRRRVAERTRA